MTDQNKTKQQLIVELEITRQRVAELEGTCAQREEKYQQLLTVEREQRALAEALCQMGATLTSTVKRDEVLDRILEQISRVVVYDAACIILIEGEQGRIFRWRGYAQFSDSGFVVSEIPNLADIPVLQRIRNTHQALAVAHADQQDEWINRPGRNWVKSYAIIPIISRGRVIGLLNIDSKTPSFIDQNDAKVLQAFADQAAIALENSWLYDQVRQEIARRIRALKKERNFVNAILDTVGALVIVLDPQGRIIKFNRAYEEATGFLVSDIRGRHFWELFLTPEEIGPVKNVFHKVLSGQYPSEHKSYLKTRNGDLRVVVWTNTVLQNNQGQAEYIISAGLDITEHQRTTEALRQNQSQFKLLTDQLPVGVYKTNKNGMLLQANSAMATLFDYNSVEELLNTSTATMFGNLNERVGKSEQYREAEIIQNEVKCRTKSGNYIWIRNTGRVARRESGEVDYIRGTIENITERKLVEEALRESEERFQHVLSSISDHVYVTQTMGDGNLKALYISPHVETLTGYPQDKFKADWRFWLTVVIHPNDRVVAGTHMARAMMGRSSEVEYRLIRADGRIIWVRDSVRAETKKLSVIIYGVVSDITERKYAEEALAAEQERLTVTLRSITDGVVAINSEKRIVLANPVGREMLEALTTADIGNVITQLGHTSLDEILAVTAGSNDLFELQVGGPPPRIFEVVVQKMDVGDQVRGWVLIIRDVTEKRAAQDSIRQQERLAAVGQLAAGIAHDFNNILTGIIGIAELSGDVPDLPQVVQQDMKRISELGQQAARLTRQILDFGRKSLSEKRPLGLDSFIKESTKLLNRTISENIRIDLDIAPSEYVCNADPTQMQQVFTNLAINAQDAMPEGGTLTISLTRITLLPNEQPPYPELSPGDWIIASVLDTGTGIAPEHLPHLFEPFFTTKETGKGTGLGLAQVYGIIKQHEGFIEVKSKPDQGTAFIFYLPALPLQQQPALPRQKDEASPSGNGELILLVEDNSTVLSVTRSMLERAGYRVLTAVNGQEALEVYDQRGAEIKLVLTDITMPQMGGVELCRLLHRKDKNLKVIAMTGYPLKEETDDWSTPGFLGWVSKPVGVEEIAQIISHALM